MGREKGHPGPVKPEEEKRTEVVRFCMTKGERRLLDKRVGELNVGAIKKVTISSYFCTLMAGDLAKNGWEYSRLDCAIRQEIGCGRVPTADVLQLCERAEEFRDMALILEKSLHDAIKIIEDQKKQLTCF